VDSTQQPKMNNRPDDSEAKNFRDSHEKPIHAACHAFRKFQEPFLHWRSLENQIVEKYKVSVEEALDALQALINHPPVVFYKKMTDRAFPLPLSRWPKIVVGWTTRKATESHSKFVEQYFGGNPLLFEFKAHPRDIILINHRPEYLIPSVQNLIHCAGFEKNEIWDVRILHHRYPAGAKKILAQSGIIESQYHPDLLKPENRI